MYCFKVFKSLVRLNNLGAFIFFGINAGIIFSLLVSGAGMPFWQVLIIYLISVLVGVSPIGEAILAYVAGGRKIVRADMRSRIEPYINNVYMKAKERTEELPENIVVKLINDVTPNVYAVGRKTICITEGLLTLPDDEIEAVLAHEIGHIALHHTDVQLLIGGSNFLVAGIILVLKSIAAIMAIFSSISAVTNIFRPRSKYAPSPWGGLICAGFIYIWTQFCLMFLRWTLRRNEYEADRYAYELGYGYKLAEMLDRIDESRKPLGALLKAVYSTHPPKDNRIGKLQELGVAYSRY